MQPRYESDYGRGERRLDLERRRSGRQEWDEGRFQTEDDYDREPSRYADEPTQWDEGYGMRGRGRERWSGDEYSSGRPQSGIGRSNYGRGGFGDRYESQFDRPARLGGSSYGSQYSGGRSSDSGGSPYSGRQFVGRPGDQYTGSYGDRGPFGGPQDWGSRLYSSRPGEYEGSQYSGQSGGRSGEFGRRPEGSAFESGMPSWHTHAGKGPKGYKRSDERIAEDINERLTLHPDIDATDVEVTVNNGEVKLSGAVTERHCKRIAEEIAENVSGVKDVRNEIRVQQNVGTRGSEGAQMSGRGQQTSTTTKH